MSFLTTTASKVWYFHLVTIPWAGCLKVPALCYVLSAAHGIVTVSRKLRGPISSQKLHRLGLKCIGLLNLVKIVKIVWICQNFTKKCIIVDFRWTFLVNILTSFIISTTTDHLDLNDIIIIIVSIKRVGRALSSAEEVVTLVTAPRSAPLPTLTASDHRRDTGQWCDQTMQNAHYVQKSEGLVQKKSQLGKLELHNILVLPKGWRVRVTPKVHFPASSLVIWMLDK